MEIISFSHRDLYCCYRQTSDAVERFDEKIKRNCTYTICVTQIDDSLETFVQKLENVLDEHNGYVEKYERFFDQFRERIDSINTLISPKKITYESNYDNLVLRVEIFLNSSDLIDKKIILVLYIQEEKRTKNADDSFYECYKKNISTMRICDYDTIVLTLQNFDDYFMSDNFIKQIRLFDKLEKHRQKALSVYNKKSLSVFTDVQNSILFYSIGTVLTSISLYINFVAFMLMLGLSVFVTIRKKALNKKFSLNGH